MAPAGVLVDAYAGGDDASWGAAGAISGGPRGLGRCLNKPTESYLVANRGTGHPMTAAAPVPVVSLVLSLARRRRHVRVRDHHQLMRCAARPPQATASRPSVVLKSRPATVPHADCGR